MSNIGSTISGATTFDAGATTAAVADLRDGIVSFENKKRKVGSLID
jgi:hypothetical protein